MTVADTIEQKITEALAPAYLHVQNESHMHNVPPGSESHFKLVIAANAFEGLRLVQRHQLVNKALMDELRGPIHALSMETLTPDEWAQRGGTTLASPACHGGSKNDPGFNAT